MPKYSLPKLVFVCTICGKSFRKRGATGPDPRHCSRRCYCVAKGYVSGVLNQGECSRCGKAFTSIQPHQKWCSVACRQAIKYSKGSSIEVACKVCGKVYRPKVSNRATCCSRECGLKLTGAKLVEKAAVTLPERQERKAEQRRQLEERRQRTCVICGASFVGSPSGKYCSRKCRFTAGGGGGFKTFTCDQCGKAFSRITTGDFKYCSKKCGQRIHQNHAKHLRKARKKHSGVDPDHIPLAKLIKRDKGVCYHCKRPIDATAIVPHPMAPTRDHFIPLSKGGPHTWDNIVLACFKCNTDKCDMLPEQDGQRLMFAI